MIACGSCFVLAAVGPAPRRAPPGERAAYLGLIAAGVMTYAAAFALPFLGLWVEGAIGFLVATSMIMFCMWLARSPLSRERQQSRREDTGEGGTKVPVSPPGPPTRPRGDTGPGGPAPDWGGFDDARAGWEQPAADRELVGV